MEENMRSILKIAVCGAVACALFTSGYNVEAAPAAQAAVKAQQKAQKKLDSLKKKLEQMQKKLQQAQAKNNAKAVAKLQKDIMKLNMTINTQLSLNCKKIS